MTAVDQAIAEGGHGVHVNTYCPHCGTPLEFFDGWQKSGYVSTALLDCGRCGIRWALQAQLAHAGRLPRRRDHHAG